MPAAKNSLCAKLSEADGGTGKIIGLLAIFFDLEFCMCPLHARFSDSIGNRFRAGFGTPCARICFDVQCESAEWKPSSWKPS